jgi:hypothetical protein
MNVDHNNLRSIVFKSYYMPAVQSIDKHGRYWLSETRPASNMLSTLLEEAGINVILSSFPPRWEFVICLVGEHDRDLFLEIASQRHKLSEQGIAEVDLPI